MCEHTGLAGTGAGHDEQRTLRMGDSFELDRIEAGKELIVCRIGPVCRVGHGALTLPVP